MPPFYSQFIVFDEKMQRKFHTLTNDKRTESWYNQYTKQCKGEKGMKRFLKTMLALLLVLALAVPAWATTPTESNVYYAVA